MKKILVTGGAGFIGSHTVVELVNEGFHPIIIDNFSNSDPSVISNLEKITQKPIVCYEGDIQDRPFLEKVFEMEGDIYAAIHFAAFKAVGESVQFPLKYYRNNIESLTVLLEVMEHFSCKYLVFSSSCTVYGQPEKLPVTEETPRQPAESPYGKTKQICEDILEDYIKSGGGVSVISLRYFNPIGAHSSGLIGELPIGVPANLVPFITQTAAGIREKLTVFGTDYQTPDGSCIRDYIHVVDLANAHVSAINYLEKNNESPLYKIFNVGVGKGYSVLEMVNAFETVSKVKLPVFLGDRRAGDIEQIFADTTKVENEMGWKAKISLNDALKDAWKWQQNISKK